MRRALSVSALVATLGVACGSEGGFAPLGGGGTATQGGDEPSLGAGDASASDSCGLPAGSAVCECTELPFAEPPPTLWFVLDRSASMAEAGKWSILRDVVLDVVARLGPRIQVAASPYPRGDQEQCTPGRIAMTPRAGDRPAGTQGSTYAVLHDVLYSNEPGGGTPLAATLRVVAEAIAARQDPGKSFVVLTTDGAPNCNDAITCDADHCVANLEDSASCPLGGPPNCCAASGPGPLNCLDDAAARAAVQTLAAQGAPTYVLGAPGSEPYRALLTQLAQDGGSGSYFAVSSAGQRAFAEALTGIAARILATCTIELSRAPDDAGLVNVLVDGVPLAAGAGWTLDGAVVSLHGSACSEVLSGVALDVRVVVGCPTVEVH